MTETWCGSLMVVLVPLVGGLNAALLAQVSSLRSEVRNGAGADSRTREGE